MSQLRGAVQAAPRKRVCALDLGTFGSGFCVALINDGAALMFERWPGAPPGYPKNRSALLYQGRKPVAWGWNASAQYAQLSADQRSQHSFIEDFKLALQDAAKAAEIQAKGLTPELVMSDYLRELGRFIKDHLRSQGVSQADLDNLQWVMSVPSAWEDEDKALMRLAAKRAGLIRDINDDALEMVLEPEAAALHAMDTSMPPLLPGMTVCVVDAGGGTVDISVHLVEEKGGVTVLADKLYSVGEPCGSAYIDNDFWEMYKERVGGEAYTRWAARYPEERRMVQSSWMSVKHAYEGVPENGAANQPSTPPIGGPDSDSETESEDGFQMEEHPSRIPIPPGLHSLMHPDQKAYLVTEQNTDNDVLLSSDDMLTLFKPTVDRVVDLVKTHLGRSGTICSVVLLVGGFSTSPYLQQRVTTALIDSGLAKEVVKPPFPYAAVMKGTALYGCQPDLIHARRTRMSYGIRQAAPYVQGAPGKFFNVEAGHFWTDSMYKRLVEKDEEVLRDHEERHYVTPLSHDQVEARIQLYITDNNDTRFIHADDPNMRHHAELVIGPLPVTAPNEELPRICVKLRFGRAELQISGEVEGTDDPVQVTVRY